MSKRPYEPMDDPWVIVVILLAAGVGAVGTLLLAISVLGI